MEESQRQAITQKKKALKRYRRTAAYLARLENRLEELDARLVAIKSAGNLSDMPRGGGPVVMADLVADKTELENRVAKLRKKAERQKAEILGELDALEDPRCREVLELFFIEGFSMEETAREIGYTLRHVYRLYSKGVEFLALK